MMFKRLCDLLLSAWGIVFFFPPACLFALAVKFEDGGPVFYCQERWGRAGRKFLAYKFRTMHAAAAKEFRPAAENDNRITKIGRLLRATAMDELPQLINIFKGDMSFVGPRALAVDEVQPSIPQFTERHALRPGLTGPAQIRAPRYATLAEKFQYDLEYIRTRSSLQDLKLMSLSLWVTFRGKWESRHKKF